MFAARMFYGKKPQAHSN